MEINKDFALLYGIMLGDGCLSLVSGKKKFITITCSLKDDLPFFETILSPILKEFRGKDTKIKFRKSYGAIEFNFIDSKMFDFIHSIGFPIGKKGTGIIIPEIFYQRNLVRFVVQGFFATDGSLVLTKNPNKYYPRIEAHAICKNLIRQITDYLDELGLNGHFYECKRVLDTSFTRNFPNYRFQFNGKKNLLLFDNLIGFVNPKHKKRFDEFIDYSNRYDFIPFAYRKDMALGRVELPISAL